MSRPEQTPASCGHQTNELQRGCSEPMNSLVESVSPIAAAYWRAPFASGRPSALMVLPGDTIADIVERMPGLPSRFKSEGVVCIDGHEIDRRYWSRVRPRPRLSGTTVNITLHLPLQGGGGGGSGGRGRGKAGSIFAIVAFVVLAFATYGISTSGLPGAAAGELFAAGTTSAKILAGAVGIAGALAISALSAPPSRRQDGSTTDRIDRSPASAGGNQLEAGGPIPRVLGTRKIFPPLGAQPLIDLVGDDEFVEALYVLAGPHKLESLRIGDGGIEDAADVEIQMREGWPDDPPIDLFSRYGVTTTPQIELSAHDVRSNEQQVLENQANPEKSIPTWHEVASRFAPEEIWLHFAWPEGLTDAANPTQAMQMPIRIRFRRRGEDQWANCPELHMRTTEQGQQKKAVKFVWRARGDIPVPGNSGWVQSRNATPSQSSTPVSGAWVAHSHFVGPGVNFMTQQYTSSSGVLNTTLAYDTATFYLDENIFPPGTYEFQVVRGMAFPAASFNMEAYTYLGQVTNLFGYRVSDGVATVARPRTNQQERCYLVRIASVWNERPMAAGGLAAIAARAKNRSIDQFSVIASGYVKDWDGVGWNEWTVTSNPAPHYAAILTGSLNPDPLPIDLVDNTSLVDWRDQCEVMDYRCDAIFQGERIDEVLNIVASCGYARPYQSEVWGVIEDRDTSADAPTQVFTPRNSSGFGIEIAFNRLPDAFRVSFPDKLNNYESTEIIVYREGRESGDRFERVSFEGIVDEEHARARAIFDLRQAEFRSRFYSLKIPMESLIARRGDLVALQHDTIDRHAASARIVDVERNSDGEITALVLDSAVPVRTRKGLLDVVDILAEPNFFDIGERTGIVIQQPSGAPMLAREITAEWPEAERIELPVPFVSDQVEPGYQVIVGPLGSKNYLRLKIQMIKQSKDFFADITLVDEAPEIHGI